MCKHIAVLAYNIMVVELRTVDVAFVAARSHAMGTVKVIKKKRINCLAVPCSHPMGMKKSVLIVF